MDRVYESGASATPPTPPAIPSTGYPSRGNASTGAMPTVPGPYMMHQLVEEIMAVTSAAGIAPDKLVLNQLKQALDNLYARRRFPASYGIAILVSSTLSAADYGKWFEIQTAGITITLPPLASVPAGTVYTFKANAGATLKGNGAELIVGSNPAVGANTRAMLIGETLDMVSNGANGWYVLSNGFGQDSFGSTPNIQRLPNGNIRQWGISPVIASGVNQVITFPLAFPNSVVAVNSTYVDGASDRPVGSIVNPQIRGFTSANFTLRNLSTIANQYFWDAVGN